jgi:hypothetical protein
MSSASMLRANVPLEDSIPEVGATLESILCTEKLQRRPSRPPDYEKENRALVALAGALADWLGTIIRTYRNNHALGGSCVCHKLPTF